jgi:hypothetical protein
MAATTNDWLLPIVFKKRWLQVRMVATFPVKVEDG